MLIKKEKNNDYYKIIGLPTFILGIIVINLFSIIYSFIYYTFTSNNHSLNQIGYSLFTLAIFMIFGFPFIGVYKLKIFDKKINIKNITLMNIFSKGFDNSYLFEKIKKILFITYSNNMNSIKLELNNGSKASFKYPTLSIISTFIPYLKNTIYNYELGIAEDISVEVKKEVY